jgi:hypothetical protein
MNFQLGIKTKEEGLEVLRRGVVHSMRLGDNFVINIDKLQVNFENEWNHPDIFPIEIFNQEEWRERERHMRIVKEEENVSLEGE